MNPALEWFPAPGKLNLFLHILGRRADGRHDLQTAFRLIDHCDRVGIRNRNDAQIRFTGAFGEENLCARAARLLQSLAGGAAGGMPGADIELEKRLPVGGGLGGGSSDAATVLLVLNRLWGLKLKRAELMELGLRLGADVPFFVYGRSALGEGVGERLRGLDLAPAWYLVLTPQVPVSTKEIFSDPSLTWESKPLKMSPFLSGQGRNDLEAVAVRRYPEIAEHLAWLRKRSRRGSFSPRMTGSGACVFAEFPREEDAVLLHSELPAALRGFVARGLERHPLYEWAEDK